MKFAISTIAVSVLATSVVARDWAWCAPDVTCYDVKTCADNDDCARKAGFNIDNITGDEHEEILQEMDGLAGCGSGTWYRSCWTYKKD